MIKWKVIYCLVSGVRPEARPGRRNIPGLESGREALVSIRQGHHVLPGTFSPQFAGEEPKAGSSGNVAPSPCPCLRRTEAWNSGQKVQT